MPHNNRVDADAFFVRAAHYECAGYAWRYTGRERYGLDSGQAETNRD